MDWKEEFKNKYLVGDFRTDSDIEDFADEHALKWVEVFDYLAILETTGTVCEKCKHIGFRYSMYPCNSCIRRQGMSDRYERE